MKFFIRRLSVMRVFGRASIVERMPVLISNQTSNTNEEHPSNDRQTNHVSPNEPVGRDFVFGIYCFVFLSG